MPCSGIDRPGAPFAHSFFHGFCAMENNPSEASDGQNLPKINFPRPRMSRKHEKQTFQPLGKSKSLNFCVSNPLESQNHSISALPTPWKDKNAPKTARRRPTKCRIAQFSLVVGRRNAKSPKNRASATAENQNHPKTAFPPRRKIKITQKPQSMRGYPPGRRPSRQDL